MQRIHARHFALEEAQALLCVLKEDLERMVRLHAALIHLNYDIYRHRYFGGRGPNGDHYHPQELEDLVQILRHVETNGVIVKSISEGLVDFPALRKEEEIYLCWKVGEEDIQYWHNVTDGFQGRRHVSEL